MSRRRLILLDRDGVVNQESEAFVKNVGEFHPIPGSYEAIARLSSAGHAIAIVSNQSGLARGLIEPEALQLIHARLRRGVEALGGRIDRIEFCPHLPDAACPCRKPRPALLARAASALDHSPSTSVLIGDRATDLAAAREFGCEAILVRTGHGRTTESELSDHPRPLVFDDLASATDAILMRNRGATEA